MLGEIILYQPNNEVEQIEVRIEGETVWLNQEQIAKLFQRNQSVVSRHIKNVFSDEELNVKGNMQKVHIPFSDKLVVFYSLNVIISVGYRVKSKHGIAFRIWATKVLHEYLYKGFSIHHNYINLENKVNQISQKVNQLEIQINSPFIPTQGVFFDGQVFDAYELASRLIRSAKREIILIDNYIDESTLLHLSKKEKTVKVKLLCDNIHKSLQLDIDKVNQQYEGFVIRKFSKSHDRFLILDNTDIYHLGSSLKDLGKKWFAFSKLEKESVESILEAVSKLS